MKWKIRVHYNEKKIEDWYKIMTEKHVRAHLSCRGFNVWNDKKQIKSIDGISYSIAFEFMDSITSIEVESKEWKKELNRPLLPPIVFLIEDYFKIDSTYWFYLETLNEVEANSTKKLERNFEPLKILLRLKEINFDKELLKPNLEILSNSGSFNIDFYSGLKIDFDNHANFWISFLSWVTQSEYEYTNLNYILKRGYFHPDNGSCIPLRKQEIENEITYTQNQIDWFNENEVQNIYLMRKSYDNRVILFTTDDKYLVYYCWTNE